MEKYLKDFTTEDYTRLYNENGKFSDYAFNEAIKMVDFWISEYLSCFKGCLRDYYVSVYEYSYIKIKNHKDFIECLKVYKLWYDLNEKMGLKLYEVSKLIERYNNAEEDEDGYKLDEEIEEKAEELKKGLLELWLSEYRYFDKNENVIAFIIDEIESNDMYEGCYIIDEDFSKVYRIL